LVDNLVLEELSKVDMTLLKSSLEKYHSAKDDTSKINALNDICENMMHQDWIKYQFFHYKLIKEELKSNNSNSLKQSLAGAINNIGFYHYEKGRVESALNFFSKSLKIQEELGNKEGIATLLNNMGEIYKNQDQDEEALDFHGRSLKIREDIGDENGMAQSLNNLAVIYFKQGELNEALEYNKKSLKKRENTGNKEGIAISLNNIAGIYEMQGQLNEALDIFIQSLEINQLIGDKGGVSNEFTNISRIHQRLGHTNQALEYGVKGFDVAMEIGNPINIMRASYLLSNLYEKQGKGIKALEMYKLHVKMKDSINNEKTQKATIRQQTQYEFEKAQIVKENEAKEVLRLETEATGRRNNLQYSLIFLGILVLFVAILMLGFIRVSPSVAEGLIFFAFLILFEFVLVFSEPYLEQYTNGEPMWNLLANSVLALLIFPVHSILERLLKKRIVK
jgi:tetratricopeptide (TPR) repeat protein